MSTPTAIITDPALPLWLVVPVTLAAAYGAWRTYQDCALTGRQRWVLWSLRLAGILILVWLLLLARERSVAVTKEPPVLVVAVDVSASMGDNPGQFKQTRRDRAISVLSSGKTEALADRYRVVRYSLGAELEEGLPEPPDIRFNAPRSHLGTCLNRVVDRMRAENLAGIVLLSDGLDQSGERPTPQSLRVPLFIPELEDEFTAAASAASDFWVADASHPKMMAVNWKAAVDVLVRRRGTAPAAFPVHLKQGDRLLRSSMAEFGEGEMFRQVAFAVEPVEVGQTLYRVEIGPQPEIDSLADNNATEFLVEVTDPKNKVLYIEGVPRWEFKFLKRALLSERNYQLSAFVRGGDGRFINFDEISGQAGAEVPAFTTEGLADYRVIVIGDMEGTALTDDDRRNIRDFVDKGGGLLLVGATKSYGPQGLLQVPYLKEVVPAVSEAGASMKEGRFTVDLTPTGRTHPGLGELAMEGTLPPLLSFWAPVKVGEFSSVLVAAADGSPVVTVRRFGQGRVAMLLSDSLWRWQLGETEATAEKSLYSRFVTQIVYWLAPSEKDVEKSTLLQVLAAKTEVELREKVTIGAVGGGGSEGGGLTCRVKTPDGKVQVFPMLAGTLGKDVGLTKTLDGFRSFFTPQEPGQYEVTVSAADGAQSASLMLLAAEPEHERTGEPINREYLSELARETGGRFVPWDDRSALFKDIPYRPQEFTQVLERSIWDRWWWIGVLTVLFCVEWWWRRKLDLV
jgi:uncharacterized membrane protein